MVHVSVPKPPSGATHRQGNADLRSAPLRAAQQERESPRVKNRGDAGAPVSDRHRAGARNLHRRRCATPISRLGAPVSDRHRAGARNLHRRRCATPISRLGAPVSDRHRAGARNLHRRRWPRQSHGLERRSLTGIARERETCTEDAAPRQSHGLERRSLTGCAGARNLHRRRWPRQSHGLERRSLTGIARERETCTDDATPISRRRTRVSPTAKNRGDGLERRPLVGTRGSAKRAPMTLRPANVSAAPPASPAMPRPPTFAGAAAMRDDETDSVCRRRTVRNPGHSGLPRSIGGQRRLRQSMHPESACPICGA